MKTLTITARPWEGAYEGGWELYDGDHVLTQVARLEDARQQVIDYLGTIDPKTPHDDWDIRIVSTL
jgi:toxin-antitoxin system, antitoxin component, hicB family